MNASFQSCLTLSLVFVALALTVTMCQGQGDCLLNERPHPGGICGRRLTLAHQNLCFYLRHRHPNRFVNRKRSERMAILDPIYSIPLSVWAELDLSQDNWESELYNRGYHSILNGHHFDTPGEGTHLNQRDEHSLAELSASNVHKSNPTQELMRMLSKRSSVHKRTTGMVCECCINICNGAQLAAYC